ncbi:protein mono-ADP-ribosyltransferase PARP12-like [Amphibalanus amphitrite]|uniref:protein mono-ADP-ribosyltransferase PARP12-like n=1 Tax=Amphibalanus amphitrite TaxID=1232801 RepID=UPI001C903187|nr:protein mono-ADP-ribosyltransferase PARP12-like [Amphibalanus amphitrite]
MGLECLACCWPIPPADGGGRTSDSVCSAMGNSNSSEENRRRSNRSGYSSEFGVEVTGDMLEEQRRIFNQIQADDRRRAEELRERQQQQQQLEAERERQRRTLALPTPVPSAPPPPAPAQAGISLPQVCYRHNTQQGCANARCRRLHVCRLFLADICKHGANCRYGHSLTTVYNQVVCNRYNLDTSRELASIQKLRRAFDENEELPPSGYARNLERCFKFGSKTSCTLSDCNRIHICRRFIAGTCARTNCKFGHDLHTTHNNSVLSRHRVTRMRDSEIIELLRQKENPDGLQAGGAAAPSAPSVNSRRQQSAKPAGGPNQKKTGGATAPASPAGISDELQCPVCLDMFNRATTLGCGHTFCAQCLEDTRRSSDNKCPMCPMCRAVITSSTHSVTLDNIIRSVLASQ